MEQGGRNSPGTYLRVSDLNKRLLCDVLLFVPDSDGNNSNLENPTSAIQQVLLLLIYSLGKHNICKEQFC